MQVRGQQLSDPAVVGLLQPFIVTYWNGAHEVRMKDQVMKIFRQANLREQNNMFAFVLDHEGALVYGFQCFEGRVPRGGPVENSRYFKKQIDLALWGLRLPKQKRKSRLSLPDVSDGVRVYVRLAETQGAYAKPVVETVKMSEAVRRALARPSQKTTIPASTLASWLGQIYPPGMMEQTNRVERITGDLEFRPVGRSYAILEGSVGITLGGQSYRGTLSVVVSYGQKRVIRGVYEGAYPRYDRYRKQTRSLRLVAAIESRPK